FINKMDVVGANFENAIEEIRERLEGRPLPLILPIGSGSPKDSPTPFIGIIDLVEMQVLYFDDASFGKTFRKEPIPADLMASSQGAREHIFNLLTENDPQDLLTSAYLDGRAISADTLRTAIREQTLKRLVQPVLCASGREPIA